MPWFAVPDDGAARRVTGAGLVVGRAPTCDVVLREAAVSRRHVLLQVGFGGQLDIVPLPGARTAVNDVVIDTPVVARDGDVLGFPGGARLRLRLDGDASEASSGEHAWMFDVRGRRIGLRREVLAIGGGDDDVMIETWPQAAARLTWRDDQPWFEARVEDITHNAAPLARGVAVALAAGDQLTCRDGTITIAIETVEPAATHREAARLTAITLEMLPTGGMVIVQTTHAEHRVLLAERRFALVLALLHPPAPFAPGDYLPDEVVFGAVWPRSESANRGDLNQLVHRLRADLKAAGLPAAQLLERYSKGGAIRFVVEPGVVITTRL
ncbi:MAG: FHA domain-containing protein [Myxococcota bacterium]|nr:FHA domain-containing protein [Myxococcota bacterium]